MKNLVEQYGETLLVFVVCSAIITTFVTILLLVTQQISLPV